MKDTITIEEFSNNAKVKIATIKRRYKEIPGISKIDGEFVILSGTRYPCRKNNNLKDSYDRRYYLLKAISEYKYIDHNILRIEHKQFIDMLKDLLSAKLIKRNGLSNYYGANAYDCTSKGEEVLKSKKDISISEISKLIIGTTSDFVDILSKIYNFK